MSYTGPGEEACSARSPQGAASTHDTVGVSPGADMLAPSETGIAAGTGPSQQRQAVRGQRGQVTLPSSGGSTSVGNIYQSSHSPQQLQEYPQQLGYPLFHAQRSGPFPQGQASAGPLTPYGWLPYNVGYQVFGDQLGQSFLEGQHPHNQLPPYQLAFQGHQELPNYVYGGGRQGFMQPFFPHLMQFPLGRGRPARTSKPAEESSDSFNFDLTEARDQPESARRTLMLRNIPNKYTIHMLLDMLDKCHKRGANELVYDFCYLPIDFKNRCNLGYAFVNFVDAAATAECYAAFNSKRWNDFNSKKARLCPHGEVCEVKYARVQGKDALIEHFRNSKFPSNDIDCLPLLFEKVTLESGEQTVQSVPLHSRQTT